MNELAVAAPEWLLAIVSPDWFERYSTRFEQYRLPKTKAQQEVLAVTIGEDGHQLLAAVTAEHAPMGLALLKAVEILRLVWIQQYYLSDKGLVWRTASDLPPNQLLIPSPYDTDARNRTKGETNWTGYAVHLTETCEQDLPNLITHVETSPATTHDGAKTQVIHQALAALDLLPSEHFVDTAYVDAEHLVTSQMDYSIDLVGPAPSDTSWQAQTSNGFDIKCFAIDWQAQQVTCPTGCISQAWRPRTDDHGNQVIEVRFATSDCKTCPLRAQRKRATNSPRLLKLRPQAQYQALQTARERQLSAEFKQRYPQRAGVEGTLSQACVRFDLRRSRYIGKRENTFTAYLDCHRYELDTTCQLVTGSTQDQDTHFSLCHTRSERFRLAASSSADTTLNPISR